MLAALTKTMERATVPERRALVPPHVDERPHGHPFTAGCPADELQGVLFNHIAKSGGSLLTHILKGSLLNSHTVVEDTPSGRAAETGGLKLILQDGLAGFDGCDGLAGCAGGGVVTAEHARHFFVIGLVRRPCDHALSSYVQQHEQMTPKPPGLGGGGALDRQRFREHLARMINASEALGAKRAPWPPPDRYAGAYIPFLQYAESTLARARGYEHAHCVARMHSLKDDFKFCMHRYQRCGGHFAADALSEAVLDEAIAKAAEDTRANGRSVGDHASCDTMFADVPEELRARIEEHEEQLIDKYALGGCC